MIIALDMDGVVCSEEKQFSRSLAIPLEGARDGIAKLRAAGHKVILHSARTWAELEMTEDWLERHEIEVDAIQLGKIAVDVHIDDRAIRFTSWNELEFDNLVPAEAETSDVSPSLADLRFATKSLIERVALDPQYKSPVLEIGPMDPNSSIFKKLPDTFVDAKKLFESAGKHYETLDIYEAKHITTVGTLLDAHKIFEQGTFSTILAISALEHIPELWKVPPALKYLLAPGGKSVLMTPWNLRYHGPRPDCWRISDDGYEALFSESGLKITNLQNLYAAGGERTLHPFGVLCEIEHK